MHKYILCFVFALNLGHKALSQCDSMTICTDMTCCKKELSLPSGIMLGHIHAKGQGMISYRFMNMNSIGTQQEGQAVSTNDVFSSYLSSPEAMYMNMHMLMAMYGLSDKLTVMAMFNYSASTMHMQMYGDGSVHSHNGSAGDAHEMSSSGLGDLKLYATYSIVKRNAHRLLLSAGVSLPTATMRNNLTYMMQLGSGTYDALPALTYLLSKSNYSFAIQTWANVRIGYNKLNYSLGNEYVASSWFSYKLFSYLSASARGEFCFSQQTYGINKNLIVHSEPSANPNNYGGYRASAYVGIAWQPTCGAFKNWQCTAEYGLPLYQYLIGIQSPTRSIFNANLNYTF